MRKKLATALMCLSYCVQAAGAIDNATIDKVITELTKKVPAADKARMETGVRQTARLWIESDGSLKEADGTKEDFEKFCLENFAVGADKDLILDRFADKLEALVGHFTNMERKLRWESDVATGELKPVDSLFAAYAPSSHIADDMFKNKLAFIVVLNFPILTLEQTLADSSKWTRRQWAEARLAQSFAFRVPADVLQKVRELDTKSEEYINSYHLRMDAVVDKNGKKLFADGLRLITHWGLRDQLKSLYPDADGLNRQEIIYAIMQRIISQDIPEIVRDNKDKLWDPIANTVDGKPSKREPDTRYENMLKLWRAEKLQDPYYPGYASKPDRIFRLEREIPESEVEAMLTQLLKDPVSKKTADLISKRLNRKLQPFDIWYAGFKPSKGMKAEEMDALIQAKYPTAEAFQKDIPNIMLKLGFNKETSDFIGANVRVNPARGPGHASGQGMKDDKAYLRTSLTPKGMNYQGYNIAMHELGHNVEQTFSMHRTDNFLMASVPNTAFTEGFAFVFQDRDLAVLGIEKKNEKTAAMKDLNDFWATREIAGVALVDMKVWHWMYDHPKATPQELKLATVEIAKNIWNEYYAPIFGVKDSPILAIYSHMICFPMYLANYPLGHIIAFQVEDYFKTHPLGSEMERMCKLGKLTPAEWMKQAVGSPISPEPMLKAAEKAVTELK